MKVDTFPQETADRRWSPWLARPIQVKRVLPFTMSPVGSRMHRVRTASIYPANGSLPARISPRTWCGCCAGSRWPLYADPGEFEVCGTCEGRAIGAGQIPPPPGWDQYGLLFTPRLPVVRCGWEACFGRGYSTRWGACGARARSTATRGDETIYVCKTHEHSAHRKGFELTEGVPLDPNRS